MRMPRVPRGLAARIRKMETKLAKKAAVDKRKKEIAAMKKKAADLAQKLRK